MSFYDPDESSYQAATREANAELARLQQTVNANAETMTQVHVQFHPLDLLHMRVETLINHLMSPQADEDGNFLDMARIQYEIAFAQVLVQHQEQAIAMARDATINGRLTIPTRGPIVNVQDIKDWPKH